MNEIITKLQEAADIHSLDCCVNSDYGCDGGVSNINCCDNIKFIVSLIKDTIEFMSHDINFKNEEQRKKAVEMYYESLDDK